MYGSTTPPSPPLPEPLSPMIEFLNANGPASFSDTATVLVKLKKKEKKNQEYYFRSTMTQKTDEQPFAR